MLPQRQSEPVTSATMALYGRHLLELAYRVPESLLATIDVSLPGLDLRVKIPEGGLAAAIRAVFVPFEGTLRAPPRKVEVTVLHPGVADTPQPLEWGCDCYAPHEISKLLSRAGLQGSLFHDLRFWQFYDVSAGRGVQLMESAESSPPWEPGAPLRAFLHWEYASQGRRMTHAGTLGLNGRGVLLAGAGGTGKSGTVLSGLLNGLSSVGDDYVLVDLDGGRVSAYPIFKTLKQDAAGTKRLGLDRVFGPRPLNWQGKIQFSTDDIKAEIATAGLSIGAILIPKIGAEATRIRTTTRSEALLALAPSAVYQMPGERESGFRFFSRLVAQLPVYRLELGPDPEQTTREIATFINELPA